MQPNEERIMVELEKLLVGASTFYTQKPDRAVATSVAPPSQA
jgi:hypothetical protein